MHIDIEKDKNIVTKLDIAATTQIQPYTSGFTRYEYSGNKKNDAALIKIFEIR